MFKQSLRSIYASSAISLLISNDFSAQIEHFTSILSLELLKIPLYFGIQGERSIVSKNFKSALLCAILICGALKPAPPA
jgi:hypothetical protein